MLDVVESSTQLQNLQDTAAFDSAIAACAAGNCSSMPQFAMIAPNDADNCHNSLPPCTAADTWFSQHIGPLLALPMFQPGGDGVLILTVDNALTDTTNGGGAILWMAYGPRVNSGYLKSSGMFYNHTNLTTTILTGFADFDPTPSGAPWASAPAMSEFFVGPMSATPVATNTPTPTAAPTATSTRATPTAAPTATPTRATPTPTTTATPTRTAGPTASTAATPTVGATATATPAEPTPTATGIADVTEESSVGSQTSASLSVNFPNGSTAAGEVALMFLSVDTTYSEGYPTITTPTGWNLIYSVGHDNQDKVAVYDRVLTGSETSSYPVVLSTTAGSAYGWSAIVKVFSGVNTTTPIDSGASTGTLNYGETEVVTGNSTPFSTSQANDAVVLFGLTNFFSNDKTQTFTWPSGFSQIAEVDEDTLGQASIGTAWHVQSTSGTTGALTVNWSSSLGSSSPLWEIFSVGLKPAAGGTPVPTTTASPSSTPTPAPTTTATPTPTPTKSPTPTPTRTPTRTPSGTPTRTPTRTPTLTPTPTTTATPTRTAAPTASTAATPTVGATATATPAEPTPTATGIADVTEESSVGSQTGTSLSVNFPNGSTAAGEVALMFLSVDTTYSEGYPTITTPTGWNLIYSVGHDNQDKVAVYDRVLTGSETSSYPVVLSTTAGSAYGWSAIVKVFSGVNTTTPIDSGASTGTLNYAETEVVTGNSTPFSTSQANDAVVLFALTNFFSNDKTQTFTWPSGFSQIAEVDEGTLGQASIGTAWHVQSTSGTTGALTVNWSSSLGSSSPLWEIFSVGLKPAAE